MKNECCKMIIPPTKNSYNICFKQEMFFPSSESLYKSFNTELMIFYK